MNLFAFRFLSETQTQTLFGYFEIYKIPNFWMLEVSKVFEKKLLTRALQKGDKIYIYKGVNELIFRTWDGTETIVNSQKEFITNDGYRGTFWLSSKNGDCEVLLRELQNADTAAGGGITDETWHRAGCGYIADTGGFDQPTGIRQALEGFVDDNSNTND